MFKRRIIGGAFTLLSLVGIALIIGCGGLSQRPLAPTGAPTQALTPSKALPQAAKVGVYTQTARGTFYPDQAGSLSVSFPPYGDNQTIRVESATFAVAQGAIAQKTQIAMQVYTASLLSDVVFDFSPDGLTFNPQATLTVILSGPVNSQTLKAYHISSNLTVTQASFTLSSLGGNRWQVVIQVPGFSIYTLGDDLVPEAGP